VTENLYIPKSRLNIFKCFFIFKKIFRNFQKKSQSVFSCFLNGSKLFAISELVWNLIKFDFCKFWKCKSKIFFLIYESFFHFYLMIYKRKQQLFKKVVYSLIINLYFKFLLFRDLFITSWNARSCPWKKFTLWKINFNFWTNFFFDF